MKLNRKTAIWGILAALLLSSSTGFALTLGKVRGTPLLGKPLDLSVLVPYAAEDDVSANCFDAEVQYGDSAIERSLISVSSQPSSQPGTQIVRVTASGGVDEALVRLTLKAVCGPKATRSYTLLSDVASELTGSAAPAAMAVDRANGQSRVPASGAPEPTGKDNKFAAASASVRKPMTATMTKPVPVTAGGVAVARPKAAMPNSALEDLQHRVEDIAKWQASNNSAEELQKSEARAKVLETDIRGLQIVTAKNQQSIQQIATAMETSGSGNYGRSMVYTLIALLLASMAALVYVAMRRRSTGADAAPWWSGEGARSPAKAAQAKSAAQSSAAPATALTAASEAAPNAAKEAQHAAAAANPSKVESVSRRNAPVLASAPVAPMAAVPVVAPWVAATVAASAAVGRPVRNDFVNSAQATLRSINTREMLDVRQQAEFFMALGQHDEAVRLLESSIHGNAESNPLVYLDLLKILHTLSRRSDFEQIRSDFNHQFTGRIPAYADFLAEGNGLEAYDDICNQIVVLWPTEYTIDYIEQCLVRLPDDDPEQGMDLEAFKDLLLLYGVLKRLDQSYDSSRAPFSASRPEPSPNTSFNAAAVPEMTSPLPVSHVAYQSPAVESNEDLDLDLDLDLNLDQTEQESKAVEVNNLIDFDVSSYITPKKAD